LTKTFQVTFMVQFYRFMCNDELQCSNVDSIIENSEAMSSLRGGAAI